MGAAVTRRSPHDPPHNGTDTSIAAAESVRERAARLRRLVFEAVAREYPGGLTRQEIETLCGMNPDTVRPRVWELVNDGLLMDSDATRPARSGNDASVVVMVPGAVFHPKSLKKDPAVCVARPSPATLRDAAELIKTLWTERDAFSPMPPELELLTAWIEDGARCPKGH